MIQLCLLVIMCLIADDKASNDATQGSMVQSTVCGLLQVSYRFAALVTIDR